MVELGKSSSIENKRFQLHCQEIRVGCLQGKNHSMSFHRRDVIFIQDEIRQVVLKDFGENKFDSKDLIKKLNWQ
uniref:Uncharacterized protein n=1 Tax=Vespula pensylvanica TaxID=30213 RepID=A0A834MZ11_VESPE|nr:hypothetical protein H0235_017494 [Vespula pensylvanica]